MEQETAVIVALAACSIGSLVLGAYCTRSKDDVEDDYQGNSKGSVGTVQKNPVASRKSKSTKKKKGKTPKSPTKEKKKSAAVSKKNDKTEAKSRKKEESRKKAEKIKMEAVLSEATFDDEGWETISPQARSPKRKVKKAPQEGADGEKKSPKKKDTKPAIETVYVPIEEGNIGRLVGKAGANVKRIEKETGARISVTTDTPDKPQVLIKGRSDQVNAAKTQIELSISRSDSGKGQKQPGKEYEATEVVDLKTQQNRSLLIGQKGATIRNMENVSSAMFAVDRDTNNVKISGTKIAVAKGVKMVRDLIANANFEKVIDISRDEVGAVLGKKGARIQGIEKSSKARLKVIRNEELCKVSITGMKANVLQAEALIKKALENAANPIYEVNEGEIVEERELGEAVSTVIGQKGKNIHKIKDESKVRIKIAKKATKCFIIGTPENVKKAQNMIDETISRYENFLAKKKTADEAQDNAKKEDSELEDGEIVEDYPIKTDDLNKSGNWGDMED